MSVPQDGAAFGKWLAGIREAAGMTQQELAQAAGTTARTLQRWEAGTEKGVEVIRVLTALGVKIDPPVPYELRALNSLSAQLVESLELLDEILLRERAVEEAGSASDVRTLEEVAELVEEGFARLEAGIVPEATQPAVADALEPDSTGR